LSSGNKNGTEKIIKGRILTARRRKMADKVADGNVAGDGDVDSAGDHITISGPHRTVLIYRVKKEKEPGLPEFCTKNVRAFLETAPDYPPPKRADFWTVQISDDVLLLVCLIDVWGSSWNGIKDVTDYLYTDQEVRITSHDDWYYNRP
jgi:hypothetical protein